MKTERKLFLDLKEFVESIAIVDIHAHIDWNHPHARSPQGILFYHYIATELRFSRHAL